MTPTELAPRFFIAVAVILLFCKLIAWLLGKVGQPPVVSEMLAGVLLGPSLLGLLFPGVQNALFPAPLLPILYVVGQVGLVLFMFQAGYAFAGHKTTRLVGTRVTAPLTPRMFTSVLLQYNSSTRSYSTNARFRWEYQPGSELFVVFTEGRTALEAFVESSA